MLGPLFIRGVVTFQKIGEEQELHHHEEDENLHKDYEPQRLADCHVPEAVVVEVPYPSGENPDALHISAKVNKTSRKSKANFSVPRQQLFVPEGVSPCGIAPPVACFLSRGA